MGKQANETDNELKKASLIKRTNFLKTISIKNLFSFYTEYKIVSKNGPPAATTKEFITAYAYFWGLKKPIIIANNCEGNGFHSVICRRNLKQYLISIISLGIISPVSIGWECSKDNQII